MTTTLELSCVSLGDRVLCVLDDAVTPARESWQRVTPREREVLAALADGRNTGDIARQLGISAATVRTHVSHMRERFGAATRAALIASCFRAGILE